jgi:hypothetical protein
MGRQNRFPNHRPQVTARKLAEPEPERSATKRRIKMGNALFAISAYIFMRAFEVIFSAKKESLWYKRSMIVIGCAVLYTSVASMIWFYFNGLHLLGFDPK